MDTAQRIFNNLHASIPDKHKWKHKEGKFKDYFRSSNTWNIIRRRSPIETWSEGLWFTNSTPKYSFLCWLAIKDRLSTGDRMSAWTIGLQLHCTFCGCTRETGDHLFFICRFSDEVWKSIFGNLIPNGYSQSWNTVIQLITQGTPSGTTTFLIRYAFQTTLYHLWREINSRRHGQQPSSSHLIIKLIGKNIINRICSLPSRESDLYKYGLDEWFATRRPFISFLSEFMSIKCIS